jgi:hypothetical protein
LSIVFFCLSFSLFNMFLFLKNMNNKYCINIYLSVLSMLLDHNFKYVTAGLNSSTSGFEFSGMWHAVIRWMVWHSWIRALWYNYKNNQQDALYRLIYYSKSALRVLGDVFVHHQEHFTVFTVSGSVHPSCCPLVPRKRWVSTHSRHQLAATCVNTTRYCKYSQVLLMMGENIAWNT